MVQKRKTKEKCLSLPKPISIVSSVLVLINYSAAMEHLLELSIGKLQFKVNDSLQSILDIGLDR